MADPKRPSDRSRDRILRNNPEQALGVRFARLTGSTSKRERGFLIIFLLILALICFIVGIFFWTYTSYSTLDLGGGVLELPYYPLQIYAIMLWIMAVVFAIGGNVLALMGK
jgi:hypothetical protein